jgi:glycosyltransferase involved in cell wall biosynthesis
MSHWILIPVFNEAASVGDVVRAAGRHGPVIVVDDGSTDGSAAAAREAGAEVFRHARRRGKGAAIRSALAHATARGAHMILTLDGDGQHDPDEIPRLLEAARQTPRTIIIGDRLGTPGAIPPGRRNAHRVAGFFINWLTETSVRDTQSGFRVYPADLFRDVPLGRGGFVLETEGLVAAARAGYPIREVGVTAIYPRGRRSRFHPLRDGCAVGVYLGEQVLARLAAEAWGVVRRAGSAFSPAAARRRQADLWRETLAYRATSAHWGLATGAFVLRRMAAAFHAWWNEARTAQLRLVGAAAAAFPVLVLLTLLHPVTSRCSLDPLTPFIQRFYSQDRLARARGTGPVARTPAPAGGRGKTQPAAMAGERTL